jgi:hypothetical protein
VPNPTRRDPQVLRDLRAGLDRGGEPRTWREVAEIAGITAPYANRVATGKMARLPPVLWIDPRDIIPEFADRLSDEDVLVWNEDPRCLCGCGEATLQEGGNKGKVPYGAFRLFRGAHEKRMPWARIRIGDQNRELERRRRIALAKRAQNVATPIIAGLLDEWRIRNNTRGFGALSVASHLAPNHLRDIANGRHERIRKRTAAKILAALDEPMPPEIFREYKAWAKSKGLPYSHVQVNR